MQNDTSNAIGYSFTLLGGTVAFTMADLVQVVGLIGMFVGIAISAWGHLINRQRTAEMKRANDIRERELDAKAKDN